MRTASNITGQRFGRLIALSRVGTAKNKSPIWLFQCDCGVQTSTRIDVVRSGTAQSCGCFNKERSSETNKIHGCSYNRTPEYNIWLGMRRRCLDENNKDYHYYGGRGIKICAEWDDFARFLEDMGPRPTPDHSIDRIDNEGDYEKSNCRWATDTEQIHNRRDAKQKARLHRTLELL